MPIALPSGTVSYAREAPAGPSRAAPRGGEPAEGARTYRLLPLPKKRAGSPLMQASLLVRPQLSAVAIRPEVTVNAALIAQFARKYSLQRLARLCETEALLPCTGLGELYRQVQGGASQAVGCQDSFKLGQTEFRQYQHLPALDQPGYQVWRSLQRPGRFLVAPTRFDFTRFGPADGDRAFRPAV